MTPPRGGKLSPRPSSPTPSEGPDWLSTSLLAEEQHLQDAIKNTIQTEENLKVTCSWVNKELMNQTIHK